jgi:hypothetical protein
MISFGAMSIGKISSGAAQENLIRTVGRLPQTRRANHRYIALAK